MIRQSTIAHILQSNHTLNYVHIGGFFVLSADIFDYFALHITRRLVVANLRMCYKNPEYGHLGMMSQIVALASAFPHADDRNLGFFRRFYCRSLARTHAKRLVVKTPRLLHICITATLTHDFSQKSNKCVVSPVLHR